MKKPLLLVAVALVAGVAGFAAYHHFAKAPAKEIADATLAPDFTMSTLEGGTAQLSNYRGKLVLVNFWATWCAPCLQEIPLLVQMQGQYAARGLQIIGPALDDPEQVKVLLPRLKIQYPVLIGENEIPLAMEALGDTLGALPYSVLISPDGYVIKRKHGEFEAEELTALIEANLPRL